MTTRRDFMLAGTTVLAGGGALQACSGGDDGSYRQAVSNTWRHTQEPLVGPSELQRELVRYATLAPSSHNTQCWKFKLGDGHISILPDASRRCPAVDPDDHHLYVSLGCAAENLVQAAQARGLHGDVSFDSQSDWMQRVCPIRPSSRRSLGASALEPNTTAKRYPPVI